MSFGARAEIRLGALRHNFRLLTNITPGAKVLCAVKANAYGHGLLTIARALDESDSLAVARMPEALKLRQAGIDKPVVLMGGVLTPDDLDLATANRCELVVHSELQVRLLESRRAVCSRVWLKVDTGMNRLGVRPDEALALVGRLRAITGVTRLGIMTHLANADDLDDPATARQIESFRKLTQGFDGDVSVANSAALLGWPTQIAAPGLWNNDGDCWIRPGISLYGIAPIAGRTAADFGLQAVMQFESSLIALKPIRKGERVGYGGKWTAGHDSVLGIAAAGYGDGYSRFLPSGTPVLVNGRRAKLAGIVSMDLAAIDLGPGATDSVGDAVTLWGNGLPVEEVAGYAGTTAYPLVCGVADREGRLV